MKTLHKNYELPAVEHEVLEDLEKINKTLCSIDEDCCAVEGALSSLDSSVNDIVKFGVHTDQLSDTTIDNIESNRYLVVNSDGSKLHTIEGGGDAGGNTHEVLVKKSDKNYDTKWENLFNIGDELNVVSVDGSSDINSNSSVIVGNSASACSSHSAFYSNQIKSDKYDLELNNSYILTNSVEDAPFDDVQKATKDNLGVVKIGDGVDVDNGSISVVGGGDATKTEYGTVMPGDGFSVDDGEISFDGYSIASSSKAGIVKIGSGFGVNEDGGLEMIISGEPIIYNLGKIKGISGNKIIVEENVGLYRAEISSDTDFSIDTSNFTQTKDMSFYVEIVANRLCDIKFNNEAEFSVIHGSSLFKVSKLLGDSKFSAELIKFEGQNQELLTLHTNQEVNSDYYVTSSTSAEAWIYDFVYNLTGTTNMTWRNAPRQLDFAFASPVIVDYLWWRDDTFDEENPITLNGSTDGENWHTLLVSGGAVDDSYKIRLSNINTFKYYKLTWSGSRSIKGFALFGYRLPQTSQFTRVTPIMDNLVMEEVELTSSGTPNINISVASNVNCYGINVDSDTNNCWCQYYFPNGAVANCMEILSRGPGYGNKKYVCQTYNQILSASNDGENWLDLLSIPADPSVPANHAYIHNVHEFANTNSYKYYRYKVAATTNLQLCRFILYQAAPGREILKGELT